MVILLAIIETPYGQSSGFGYSDRRLKENIIELGNDKNTGLPLYEFNYIGKPNRYRGVMADDVEKEYPEAVIYEDDGFAKVNYRYLGIDMIEI